jgi:hypothetical protein
MQDRFFVDIRSGIIAVSDREKLDPLCANLNTKMQCSGIGAD